MKESSKDSYSHQDDKHLYPYIASEESLDRAVSRPETQYTESGRFTEGIFHNIRRMPTCFFVTQKFPSRPDDHKVLEFDSS